MANQHTSQPIIWARNEGDTKMNRCAAVFVFAALVWGCAAPRRETTSSVAKPDAELMRPATMSSAASRPTTLPSGVFNFDQMTAQSTASGERRSVLQQATATLDQLEVHMTTLDPGKQAHAPHRHPHEEMMFLKEGTLEAFLNGQHFPMPTGSIFFVAPFDLHNVRNVGTTRATYFVVTWRTPRTGPATRP
jgi:quercetin dioxygenase-like cupin family protein